MNVRLFAIAIALSLSVSLRLGRRKTNSNHAIYSWGWLQPNFREKTRVRWRRSFGRMC